MVPHNTNVKVTKGADIKQVNSVVSFSTLKLGTTDRQTSFAIKIE